jgi:hypothetical protein
MWDSVFKWMGFASAATSAISELQKGKAHLAAAKFNSTIERQNAAIVRENTKMQVQQHDREMILREGAVRAAQGKAGGTASGSVLDILADTAAQGEIQRQDIVYRGALAERGHYNTAELEDFSGKNQRRQSYLSAGSELLEGGVYAYNAFKRTR